MFMPEIKIYSTPWCTFCKMEKEWLSRHGIEFEDINVAADREAAEEMIEKTGQTGVPVTEIDGRIIIGFDKTRIKMILGIRE